MTILILRDRLKFGPICVLLHLLPYIFASSFYIRRDLTVNWDLVIAKEFVSNNFLLLNVCNHVTILERFPLIFKHHPHIALFAVNLAKSFLHLIQQQVY